MSHGTRSSLILTTKIAFRLIMNAKKIGTIFITVLLLPIAFKEEFTPPGTLIHRGVFSPDLNEYYYTISDKQFEQFDVYVVKKVVAKWSAPQKAFFNSKYSEHGMSFSPDGNSLYFSSTRPTNIDGVSATWHIWKSERIGEEWSTPTFVDIPNLRTKLVSHPTIASSGSIYFHSSNLDYSEMDLYHTEQVNGRFQPAKRIPIPTNKQFGKCTPYVSPNEELLIFASIGDQLDLMISHREGKGKWGAARKLNKKINTSGQGNPYLTPDNRYLFFTTGNNPEADWKVKWVNITAELVAN